MTLEEMITDAEVEVVHGNANFGPSISKRDVISGALLKTVCGFHTGSTAQAIIIEHGLVTSHKNPMKLPIVKQKGRDYLWACFGTTDL